MKRLITQDKVVAVVGPDLSSTVRAVMPLVEESKMISYVMTPVIKPPAGSYMLGIYPIQEYAYEAQMVWLKKKNLTKLGVLASTDTTGQKEGVKFLRELAGKYGITLNVENFNLQDVDVTPQLLNLQRGGAQAIMAAMSGKPFAVVAKGMKQLNMKLPLLASTGAVTKTLGELLKGYRARGPAGTHPLKMVVAEQLPNSDENKGRILELIKAYRAGVQGGHRPLRRRGLGRHRHPAQGGGRGRPRPHEDARLAGADAPVRRHGVHRHHEAGRSPRVRPRGLRPRALQGREVRA